MSPRIGLQAPGAPELIGSHPLFLHLVQEQSDNDTGRPRAGRAHEEPTLRVSLPDDPPLLIEQLCEPHPAPDPEVTEVHGGGTCGSDPHMSEYGAVAAGTWRNKRAPRGAAELLSELRAAG